MSSTLMPHLFLEAAVDLRRMPCGSGRKQVVIEVATIDEDSEEELEDVETPNQARMKRWERVAQAAVKQCLRFATPVTN